MNKTISKHKELFWALYIPAYFVCFILLEKRDDVAFHTIHCSLDDKIPFIDYFIIPYLMWFLYIAISVTFFFFWNKFEFNKLAIFLALGMTSFLIISFLYPNQLTLRPETESFPDHGIVTEFVKKLYKTDTSTNVLPSIHVFNTLAVTTAFVKNGIIKKHKLLGSFIIILTIAIIASTLFLKQHSIIDVVSAFVMAALFYYPAYVIFPRLVKDNDKNK